MIPGTQMCGNAHDDVPAIACELPEGHAGNHEGYAVELVTWERDEEEAVQP